MPDLTPDPTPDSEPFTVTPALVARATALPPTDARRLCAELTASEREDVAEGFLRGGEPLALARLRHLLRDATF